MPITSPQYYLDFTDYDLCLLAREQLDSVAVKELARRHQALAVKIIQRYLLTLEQKGVAIDLTGDSLAAIWEAAKVYQPDRGCKFSSFLGRMAAYYCLKLLRPVEARPANKEGGNNLELLNDMPARECVYGEIEGKEGRAALRRLCVEFPNAKIRKVIELRYFGREVRTYIEIGKKLKITHQRVQQMDAEFCEWARKRLTRGQFSLQ